MPKARKHKLWITLTDEAYQLLVMVQKTLNEMSPSRVTPSVIINQALLINFRKSENQPAKRAGGGAAETLGEARRGEVHETN